MNKRGTVRLAKIICKHLFGSVLVLLLITATGLLVMRWQGDRLLTVQSASMTPVFKPGDAVVVNEVATKSIKPGDIISYVSPQDPSLIITHRLLSIDSKTGWLTTAGDANNVKDSAFPPRFVIGKVIAVAPKFGAVLNSLRHPIGLIAVIYLPSIIFVSSEIKRLSQHYKRQRYQLISQG